MRSRSLPYLARVGILVALYFSTAKLGLLLDAVSGFATAVWPPTGISLVALSLFGYRLWPGVALGAFLANAAAGASPLTAGGMAVGNTLEAVVGAVLLQRGVGFRPSLARLQDVLGLVVLGAGLSTLVSATIGVTSGWLGGVIPPANYGKAWWTWWLGDMNGDLLLAPLLFTWGGQPRLPMPSRRVAEAGALLLSAAAVALLAFGALLPLKTTSSPYLLFPFLIWAALRFGQHGAVTATFVVSIIAIWSTAHGLGPFARQTLHESLLLLQTFMSVAAATILVLAADVTERRQLEEKLRQRAEELVRADRAKDQFLAMLAHELRNPIGAISNAIQTLERLGPPEPRRIRAQEMIARQVDHQARLLDDLLHVSRIARGKIELRPERLDLARLVRDTVEDYRGVLEAAGLTLELSLPADAVWVQGDPTRLAQVVGNLLNNAAKFTDAGGTVGVWCSVFGVGCGDRTDRTDKTDRSLSDRTPNAEHRTPNTAAVIVRDSGIGIEPEMLPRLFEEFAQADRSLDRSRGGLGLGLALVKGLIELHGGEVHAASAGVGRGAEFTLRLPLAPAPAAAPAVPAPAAALTRERVPGPARVLIVEDNPDGAETLRDLLELFGCTVAVAYSGPAAVEAARQFRPEVVLCDLGLPGMDGYQVAAALQREPSTANARLIAVSGYGQEEDQQRSRAAGFDRHLTKPIDVAELQRLLAVPPASRAKSV